MRLRIRSNALQSGCRRLFVAAAARPDPRKFVLAPTISSTSALISKLRRYSIPVWVHLRDKRAPDRSLISSSSLQQGTRLVALWDESRVSSGNSSLLQTRKDGTCISSSKPVSIRLRDNNVDVPWQVCRKHVPFDNFYNVRRPLADTLARNEAARVGSNSTAITLEAPAAAAKNDKIPCSRPNVQTRSPTRALS